MICKTKSGGFERATAAELLDFLGVKKSAEGVHKVANGAQLIARASFALAHDGETERGYPWSLSTYDIDRYGERIDPAGWDYERYMQNPVVEWAHRYDIPAIGKMEGLAIDARGLYGIVKFNDKSFDPFGRSIEQRVKAGVICAGSVGFRVIEIEIPAKNSGEEAALIFRKQELLEFSICNVPANPFALAKSNATAKTELTTGIGFSQFWGNIIDNNS